MEFSTSTRRGSLEAISATVNEQDFKQKMGMYSSFIMEFYRVLMGSFLMVFVPQKCNDHICGMTENVTSGNPLNNIAFSANVITFVSFLYMYYVELKRETKMIDYLHVNPELPRDNDAVGEILVKLPVSKKDTILSLDKQYQFSGRTSIVFYAINLCVSSVAIMNNYLDDKTLTVLLTNALFMALKLYDIKITTDTDKNIFLSAYLTRKIQYNDVDPDKILVNTMDDRVEEICEDTEADESVVKLERMDTVIGSSKILKDIESQTEPVVEIVDTVKDIESPTEPVVEIVDTVKDIESPTEPVVEIVDTVKDIESPTEPVVETNETVSDMEAPPVTD